MGKLEQNGSYCEHHRSICAQDTLAIKQGTRRLHLDVFERLLEQLQQLLCEAHRDVCVWEGILEQLRLDRRLSLHNPQNTLPLCKP